MLLPSVFTFTVGPVLHVDLLSHFLTFVWKKIEVLVSKYIYKINLQKCCTDLLCNQPILSHISIFIVAQQKKSSELVITTPD